MKWIHLETVLVNTNHFANKHNYLFDNSLTLLTTGWSAFETSRRRKIKEKTDYLTQNFI